MEIIEPQPKVLPNGDMEIFPTLGPQVCDFLEERFVYGPGPIKGEPYKVRDDLRYMIYRAYEHYPNGYIIDYGEGEVVDLSGRRHFSKVVLSLPKGSAKCVAPDTEFILESGERITADKLQAGMSVQSYKDGAVVFRKVAAVEKQPLAPTYRVHTDHGRTIEVSEGHPFLVSGTQWREGMPKYHKYTVNDPLAGKMGWARVESLEKGDRLVPALDWKAPGDGQSDLGWLLGVLAGDCGGDGRFTNNDQEIVDKVSTFFEMTQLTRNGKNFSGNWYLRGSAELLKEHGLFGKNAHSKRVPEAVMRGGRDIALGYLAGLLDTDGCTVHKPVGKKHARYAEWYSVSEDNMRDIQTLLASVGFNSVIKTKMSRYKGEPYTSWTVVISNKSDLKRLANALPVVRVRNVENFEKFKAENDKGSFGDVCLDKVTYVEQIGMTETIGVEIEDTHVHVTNGLVTHNTELMALLSLVELHPDAPVRFDGYDPSAPGGLAPGRAVLSPFIPLLAPTKDQLDDLAYGVAKEIAKEITDQLLFDVNNERIMINGEGESKILPVAASAGRLDGLKPTFQCIDEAHRMFSDRHHQAVQTMENNLKKRYMDDPWQLSTTTAGDPSEPSVAKAQYDYGMKIHNGKIKDPRTFFYHRGTSDENAKFDTMGQRLKALKEASGEEAAQFRDLFSVAAEWDEDGVDKSYLERVWCNRWVQSSMTAFDSDKFRDLGDKSLAIARGSAVTLGFDGAVSNDSTAIVMTEIETGIQNLVGLWERPPDAAFQWRVPIGEVHDVMNMLMEDYNVVLFYGDPPYWQEAMSVWESKWGNKIIEWPTRNINNMYYAIRAYDEAIDRGDIAHDGNEDLIRHVASAGKNMLNQVDDEGKQKFRLTKISRDRKYDAAMAAILSWQARLDAIKQGIMPQEVQAPRRIR